MDLTRFLRVGKETPLGVSNPDEKLSAAKGTRQYMYKANPLLDKGRISRGVTKDQSRKDKRHHHLVSRRGISPSSIASEDEEEVTEETNQVQKKITSNQPDRRVRSNAAAERMKRLVEYQQRRRKQQAEETKNKKPPFKVGTYKLDSKTTTLKAVGGFHLNASKLSVQNASATGKSLFKFTATSSAKCNFPSTAILERKALAPLAAKSGSKALKSAPTKAGSKRKANNSKTDQVTVPQKDSVNSPNFQEVESPDSASQDVKINSGWSADSIEETKNESQPPAEMSEESSEKTEALTPAISSSFSQIRLSEDSSKTKGTLGHEQLAVTVSTSEAADYKTPGLTSPVSSVRGRSVQRKRRLESSLSKEVLRSPDIRADRGSSTDCKRRQLGRPISRTPAEILGLEDLFDAIDSGSPMSVLLQKSKSLPGEEDIITMPMPKKLDAAFAEITDSSESMDGDNSSEEPTKDVNFFRQALTKETDFLENQCVKWSKKIDEKTMSEDTLGRIRTAVGLARLGMDRKGRFKQFEGLIDDCEFEKGERKTTCQDLQGFWDMISGQIADAKMKFLDLERLEANGWVLPQDGEKKVAKKRTVIPASRPKATVAKSGIRAMIEARRKALAEQSERPEEENKSAVPCQLMGFNTPQKLNHLANRKSLLHSGCTSKTSSPITLNYRGTTPITPSSVKIGKPANRRLSELIMLSTRHLRKSDYFGDVEQSPVHTSVVKNAERDAKNEEDVIVMVRENEASTPANIDACNQVKVFTPIQARGSTETPKSGGRRGRKSLAPKPNLSPSFESQHSEPKPLSRILRSNKSSERQNFGIDVENPEKEHGCKSKSFKRTQKDLETDSVGVTKSTDSATKTSSKSDDLMDVDQTPLRRTRKSVMFKILEEPLSATENVSCKRRKSLATESIPDVGNDTPKQSKRGRKSIVPEQHSGDISLTPRRMKHVNYNSPLHVTFEEAKENYPEPMDTSTEKKRKRERPNHVLPAKQSRTVSDTPSRTRRSMRTSMMSNLISFESPDVRHDLIFKPQTQTGLSEPAAQIVTRKSVASANFQFNLLD